MAFEKNRVRAAVLALPLAVGLSFGAATAAQADEDAAKEDPRATIHAGNIDEGQKDVCVKAELGEQVITKDLITYERGEINDQQQYLDITELDEGVTVTAIVVKGGDNYNVYVPGKEGDGGELFSETPPWMNLRAPLNDGGKIPALSHWFLCGSYTPPETTTTTTTSETTTTTTDASETSTPSSEPTSSVPTSAETTTSETPDVTATSIVDTAPPSSTSTTEAPVVDNASDSDDLAVTGFGSSWLIWAGVLFLVAGVGAIAGVRVLRKQ